MSRQPFPASIEATRERLLAEDYVADRQLATAVFLALKLERPLFLEGQPGTGKTEIAKVLAATLGAELIRLQCYEGLDESKALYEWKYGKQLLYTQILKEKIHDLVADADGLAESLGKLGAFHIHLREVLDRYSPSGLDQT